MGAKELLAVSTSNFGVAGRQVVCRYQEGGRRARTEGKEERKHDSYTAAALYPTGSFLKFAWFPSVCYSAPICLLARQMQDLCPDNL